VWSSEGSSSYFQRRKIPQISHEFRSDEVQHSTVCNTNTKSLPSLNKAYATIVREEKQQQFTQSVEPRQAMDGAAFKASVTNRQMVNRPKCSHCQKTGHERHQCFKLIGYPPN